MTPHELAHSLEKIYGEKLKSVVLYGSAVGKDYSQKFSDHNVFCVLEEPTPAELSKSNSLIRKWTKKGNPSPLFFDPQHIETSLDVFPMEFLDIQDSHEILLGENPLKGIKVDMKNLRHQCESELKGKLLHLRSFYADNCNKPKLIAEAMIKTFPTILATFKGVMRLLGEKPPAGAKASLELLAANIDINPQVFLDVVNIRQGRSLLPRGDAALSMFEQYLTEIVTVTEFVDRYEQQIPSTKHQMTNKHQ